MEATVTANLGGVVAKGVRDAAISILRAHGVEIDVAAFCRVGREEARAALDAILRDGRDVLDRDDLCRALITAETAAAARRVVERLAA